MQDATAELYLKQRAATLGNQLKQMGVDLKHGQLLKIIAGMEGFDSYQAMKSRLPAESWTPAFCPHCGAACTLSVDGTGFVEQGEYLGNSYQSEGDADQYVCSRCRNGFLAWYTDPATLGNGEDDAPSFDVNLYATHQDWAKSDGSNIDTVDTLDKAEAAARKALAESDKCYCVAIVNNATGKDHQVLYK